MASSKPIDKMLYLTLDANFGKQQLLVMENVVFYNEEKFKSIPHSTKECGSKIIVTIKTKCLHLEFSQFATKINRVNRRLLYGLWNDSNSAAIFIPQSC